MKDECKRSIRLHDRDQDFPHERVRAFVLLIFRRRTVGPFELLTLCRTLSEIFHDFWWLRHVRDRVESIEVTQHARRGLGNDACFSQRDEHDAATVTVDAELQTERALLFDFDDQLLLLALRLNPSID